MARKPCGTWDFLWYMGFGRFGGGVGECKLICMGTQWAQHMKELLQESWALLKSYARKQIPVPADVIEAITAWYDDILEQGKKEWATAIPAGHYAKGRVKKSKAANLGERFKVHKDAILRFIWDAEIPFDNQAERD